MRLIVYSAFSLLLIGFWVFVFVAALRHVLELASLQKALEDVLLPASASSASSALSSGSSTTAASSSPSQLLPLPLDLMRQKIPLQAVYTRIPTEPNFPTKPKNCSCRNPRAQYLKCCRRRLARSHKMGCLMSEHLFDPYKPQVRKITEPREYTHHVDGGVTSDVDFREVLLLRNIFDSLVSGYLYHKSGRECWISGTGGELQYGPGWKANQDWHEHLSFELKPPRRDRSLCQYLADELEAIGMRAYVDWVFRFYYKGILAHWALAQQFPYLRERTKTICYEDLGSSGRDVQTINDVLTFWYNGTSNYEPWDGVPPGRSDGGGHATSRDVELRERLVKVIQQIDRKHYNGDIMWLNSMLPC